MLDFDSSLIRDGDRGADKACFRLGSYVSRQSEHETCYEGALYFRYETSWSSAKTGQWSFEICCENTLIDNTNGHLMMKMHDTDSVYIFTREANARIAMENEDIIIHRSTERPLADIQINEHVQRVEKIYAAQTVQEPTVVELAGQSPIDETEYQKRGVEDEA
uniref:Uncharacterized protein n=1 Tax=Romanomermis culicivorax TaxID=13658 RepID=A0A915JIB3_ROMCU